MSISLVKNHIFAIINKINIKNKMDITPQQYQDNYNNLPPSIKAKIDSEEEITLLLELCKGHNLEEYFYEIKDTVDLVLLGLIPPAEMERNIKEQVEEKENQKKIPAIVKEISEKFIAPLKKDLENLYNTEITTQKEEDTKPKKKQDGRSDNYREQI